jgi:hypothetical protein
MFLAGTPVQAGPVAISEVIQVVGSYHNPPELRLRSVSQTVGAPISGSSGSSRADSRINNSIFDASNVQVKESSLLSGVALGTSDPQEVGVVDQGSVEGTICDCGEITIPAGGFPKWPLLFLAAIPLIFIDGDCDDCEPTGTPSPTPTPTNTPRENPPQVPEPASLILFGSGLAAFGAGLRRRFRKANATKEVGEEG